MKKLSLILIFCAVSLFYIGSAFSQSGINNAAIENILTRCSVRAFSDKAVEKDKVQTLLKCAMAAPTDKNKQPWHFIVLDTPESIAAYAGEGKHAERMKKTPLIIVICADTTRMQEGEVRDIWIQDVSAATENLLLSAHAMGLGAVWLTVYPLKERVANVQKKLNLPANLIPLNAVRIGYPDAEHPAKVKDKWDEKKITYGIYK